MTAPSTATPTFFWHDYETTGADARRDRPTQFAGIRTDLDLNPVGEPVSAFCRLPDDVLPHPEATLLTGITPQQCEREGVAEVEFAAIVEEQLAMPGTCGAGYNSIRFDDEFTRNLLYRNFYDPYSREWERGNCRYDLIDVARLCYALRPQGIEWPEREAGCPSFKLEDLAAANGLLHERAHDALSDVEATIGLARAIKRHQPRLFDWTLTLRNKRNVAPLLDWVNRTPVLHVSSRYPAVRGCLAMVMPLAALPDQPGAIVVYDLASDPSDLLALDVDALRDRIFVSRADLPEGVERVPLKLVRTNKCPALAPMSALRDVDTARIGLDVDRCLAHAERLRSDEGVAAKVRAIFGPERGEREMQDPELSLYGGRFASPADRARFLDVRKTPPEMLREDGLRFEDSRYDELLFRYRARNFPSTLSVEEHERWQRFRARRLLREDGLAGITLPAFRARIAEMRLVPEANVAILDALEAWGERVAEGLDFAAVEQVACS